MNQDWVLAADLTATLSRSSDDPLVQAEGVWLSGTQIARVAKAVDTLLTTAGVDRAFAVGIVLRNRPFGFAALIGTLSSERTVVLISPFQSSSSIARDIRRLNLRAVIADECDADDIIAEACRATGASLIDIDESAGAARLHEINVSTENRDGHLVLPGTAVQMLTSGTTGEPKRVPLHWAGLSQAIKDQGWMSALMGEAAPSRSPEATLIQYAPMVQLSGLFNALQAATEGRRLVMMEKFTPEIWISATRECRQTMLGLPPAMLRMLLEANPQPSDLASLRSIRSGAAPLDPHTQATFEQRFGCPILSIYGATEFIGPVCSWSLDDHARWREQKRGSVGRVWPQIAEARTIDPETRQIQKPGETGLLEMRVHRVGPEWILTNDLARLDEDGFLYILGRADDAINRGGFKIPPDVIADVLRTHEAVFDVAVVPIPDQRLGQVPAAAIELRPSAADTTVQELMSYARSKLLAYQVPAQMLLVQELPRTAAHKINRPAVKALFAD